MVFLNAGKILQGSKIKGVLAVLFLFAVLLQSQLAKSQTVVDVTTSLGNFSIELFDSTTPATVANFLNYVTSGRYNGTFMHRSVPGFVVQGGGFVFDESTRQAPAISLDPPVVNEFNVSNTRGTVAMAKLGGDPNSATSQWFVNLADNSANLDAQNGGFTVFGRVVDPGMTVVDAIANLPLFNLGGAFSSIPLNNVSGSVLVSENFISVEMSVAPEPDPNPEPVISNRLNDSTGLLDLKIAIDDGQFIGLSFAIDATMPQVIVRALPDSLIAESTGDSSFSTFSTSSGALIIPELYVNGSIAYRNLRLTLSDAEQLLFTLESLE